MNMQLKRERGNRGEPSSRALGYFPRIALIVLVVLLLLLLGWSLTDGGSVLQKQGIQTPPATGSTEQRSSETPVENARPETGTGGDQQSNPQAGQQ
ncbi:hypothetical protein H7Q97_19085 [Ochrobactrum sp. CM-21-5]|nr:hypothetical protein [Ochrobactrum sp. CM-21-5]MBC2887486.1 hypothetical protein [Ochrobactrum sp. CM-21-5]